MINNWNQELDETGFRRVVLALLLASGVALLLHLR
jgi:hypothetical protein